MSYAIVVNLDYESNSEDICQEIWDTIKKAMLNAGFRLDNRVFIINREDKEACELARSVIEGMEAHLDFDKKHVFRYLKDFYGYSMDHTTNLLVPSSEDILISTKSRF
ncbi:MAG: hypothetical protein IMF04_00830 [Proteobacteria bacterium]|nr:hypothetical protein [Pseudomonadota bacterium]